MPASSDHSKERLRRYVKARRASKNTHLGDLGSVAERMRELAEELRTVSDRTRVLAIGEERKVLAGLLDLYGVADQVEVMKELADQIQAEREERARMESGVEFVDEGSESWTEGVPLVEHS